MKKLICFLLSCLSLLLLVSCEEEIKPLDEILNYKITIDPEQSGNLRMNYEIKWQVLNDSTEGPLEWVKIGVPNKYISSLEAKSNAIDTISYSSEDGAYVRLDLDRKYYQGEIVDLNFSFLQSHIFTLKEDQVQYEFIPGWFNEIKVKELTVFWNKKGVLDYNKTNDNVKVTENDQYYIWQASLDFGESIKVDVIYDKAYFPDLDETNTYSDETGDTIITIIVLCIIGVIFLSILVSILVNYSLSDGYYQYRGFSGRHRRYYWWYSTGYHRSGTKIENPRIVNSNSSAGHGGFSCACACACAGGGRAGCSRKDFYHPALKTDVIIKKLKENDQ